MNDLIAVFSLGPITSQEAFYAVAAGLCLALLAWKSFHKKSPSVPSGEVIAKLASAVASVWSALLLLAIVSGERGSEDLRNAGVFVLILSLHWLFEQARRIVEIFEGEIPPPPPPAPKSEGE